MKLLVIGHRIFRLYNGITEIVKGDIANYSGTLEVFYLQQNVNSINCARDIASSGNIRQFVSLEKALETLPFGNYAGMIVDIFLNIQVRKNYLEVVIMNQVNHSAESLAPVLLRATKNTIWNSYQLFYLGKVLFLPIMFAVLLLLVVRYYNIFLWFSFNN